MRRVLVCLISLLFVFSSVTAYGLPDGETPGEGEEIILTLGSSSLEAVAEEVQNEIVFPLPPYPVYLVEEPPLEGMEITPMAINDSVYYGPHTATIYQYFRDIVPSLPVGTHYVYYRADQYNYRLVYATNMTLSGSVFTAPAVNVINYYNYTTNNTNRVTRYTDTNFRVTDGGGFVYTSLGGGYPKLFEGVDSRVFQALLVLVGVCVLYTFVSRLFGSRR